MSILRQEFKKAAESPNEEIRDFINDVLTERQDLSEKDFYLPADGNTAYTLLTEKEVFKCAKDWDGNKAIKREYDLMQRLSAQGLPVPEVTYIGRENPFIGMTRMPGLPLKKIFSQMSAAEKKSFGAELGALKAQLQEKTRIPESPFLPENALEWDWDFCGSITENLEKPGIKKILSKNGLLQETLNDYAARLLKRDVFLLHNDMHSANILIDPSTKKITALIDLASARNTFIPERECKVLSLYEDQALAEGFMKAYAQKQSVASIEDALCWVFLYRTHFCAGGVDHYEDTRKAVELDAKSIGSALRSVRKGPAEKWARPFLKIHQPHG
jgi:Ser/Thr protein kinase RdoA (MazF antagonist)